MINVVGYARYSSDNQREESIVAQERAIREFCQKNNYNLIKLYKDEAISGTSIKDRTEFLELIEDSKKKEFQCVVVHKFDRFARNRYDHAIYEKKLNDNGVKLLSVLEQLNDSPESVILKSVLTGMNEYYSLNLSREVKKGLNENALNCIHNGGIPPLGYNLDEDRRYIINEIEAETVRIIYKLYIEGIGYASIAEQLNQMGRLNKLGKPFRKTSIRDILLNEKYTGIFVYGKKDGHGKLTGNEVKIEGGIPQIISKEDFEKIQIKMKNRKTGSRATAHETYYLTGVCTCGECGGRYSGGYRSRQRDGSITYGYTCINRKTKVNDCRNKPIRKEILEEFVFKTIKKEIFTEKRIKSIASKVEKSVNEKILKKAQEVKKLESEIQKIKDKIDRLLEIFLDNKISKEVFEKKNNELERELFLLTQEKNKISASKKINRESIEAFIRNFKANFNKENIKKAIIETFVKEIKVYETYVEIVLRLFPMYIDRNGGDDESRTRVRNYNDYRPLQV